MIKNSKIIENKKINSAEIAVGIPTLNEADNIAFVVKKIDQGLSKYFKNEKAVIINVDNNSSDNTREEFLNTKTKTPKVYISTPPGIRGKGNNFYNLFSYLEVLGVKAAAVVDADLKNITAEWIKIFLKPILNGSDYVTPYYARSEYDGTITNHLCYPILYGLLGYNIRQPIGGDFAFSQNLAAHWLKQKWLKTTKQYGIDIFMTLNAVEGGFKIAQAGLGAKIHKPSAPKLGPMFSQVITTLFKNIITHKKECFELSKKHEVPYFGLRDLEKPQTVSVDYKGMKATSIFNFHANEDILKRGLSSAVFGRLKKMYNKEALNIDSLLWYRIIYDAVYAYDKTDLNAGMIEALRPLYFGRVISFFKATMDKPFAVCEQEIADQAELFWQNRNYFFKKYKNRY